MIYRGAIMQFIYTFSDVGQAEENLQAAADKKLKDAKSKSEQTANSLNGLLERIKISHEIAGIWITLFITSIISLYN